MIIPTFFISTVYALISYFLLDGDGNVDPIEIFAPEDLEEPDEPEEASEESDSSDSSSDESDEELNEENEVEVKEDDAEGNTDQVEEDVIGEGQELESETVELKEESTRFTANKIVLKANVSIIQKPVKWIYTAKQLNGFY